MRYWIEHLLSTKSLAAAAAAAIGLAGWATTHHPAFAWLMLGGGGAWTALLYYAGAARKDLAGAVPRRDDVVREVERALQQFPLPRHEDERDRWRARERQLRRIVALERLILTDLPSTPSGVTLLSPEQRLEVTEFVDQAADLSRRRVLLLRALRANPIRPLEEELRALLAQRQGATGRVAAELDELIALKREQVERVNRWAEDLRLTEINLDQIETFLQAVAYDQTVTQTSVSDRIARLKRRIEARRESVEELERYLGRNV